MTDWSNWGDKFKKDHDKAHADQVRATQKQDLVNAGKVRFWETLRDTALHAVNQVNQRAGERLVLFSQDPVTDVSAFEIIYNRDGQQRKAISRFNPQVATVSTVIVNPGRPIANASINLAIQPNTNNELEFSLSGMAHDCDWVVTQMLSGIL